MCDHANSRQNQASQVVDCATNHAYIPLLPRCQDVNMRKQLYQSINSAKPEGVHVIWELLMKKPENKWYTNADWSAELTVTSKNRIVLSWVCAHETYSYMRGGKNQWWIQKMNSSQAGFPQMKKKSHALARSGGEFVCSWKFLEASLHWTWPLSQAEQLHLTGIKDNKLLVSNMLCTETSSGSERKH